MGSTAPKTLRQQIFGRTISVTPTEENEYSHSTLEQGLLPLKVQTYIGLTLCLAALFSLGFLAIKTLEYVYIDLLLMPPIPFSQLMEPLTPFIQAFAFVALCTWPAAYIILKRIDKRIDETDRKINNLWISIYHDDGLESRIKNLIAYRADDIKEQITSSSELARNGTPLDRWLKTIEDKKSRKGD